MAFQVKISSLPPAVSEILVAGQQSLCLTLSLLLIKAFDME
jgi:hypothetical protein